MAVTSSGHSCTSSKKIRVFPLTRLCFVIVDRRNKMSWLLVALLKTLTKLGFSIKLISTKCSKCSCPKRRTEKVFPICLAPVSNKAFLFCSKKHSKYLSIFRLIISLSVFPRQNKPVLSVFPRQIYYVLSVFPRQDQPILSVFPRFNFYIPSSKCAQQAMTMCRALPCIAVKRRHA